MAAVTASGVSDDSLSSTLGAAGWWLVDAAMKNFYLVTPQELALDDSDPAPTYLLKQGIPMFFVMIAVEWAVIQFYRRDPKQRAKYPAVRLNDAVVSTLLGSMQQVWLVLTKLMGLAIEVAAYRYVWENFRLFDIDAKKHVYSCFIAMLLLKDLGYYWMHRFLHTYHLMWTAHSVHHSGEDYNLATALRQGALQPFFGFVFYLPVALLGFHPHAFSAHSQLNTMVMYWIHTDVVHRLPFGMEYIFNSPMWHRLHHRPPGNANYAGFLIIWDRMFGTAVTEVTRKDLYGLAKQPNTFDPLKLNVNHFKRMADIGTTADGADDGTGKASWWYRLTAKRARHPMVFRPMALFEPIPPLKEDARASGPVRRKWDGAAPMPTGRKVWFALCSLLTTTGNVVLLLQHSRLYCADAVLCTLATGALMGALGRMCDMKPGESDRATMQTVVLLPTTWVLMFVGPFGKAFGSA